MVLCWWKVLGKNTPVGAYLVLTIGAAIAVDRHIHLCEWVASLHALYYPTYIVVAPPQQEKHTLLMSMCSTSPGARMGRPVALVSTAGTANIMIGVEV